MTVVWLVRLMNYESITFPVLMISLIMKTLEKIGKLKWWHSKIEKKTRVKHGKENDDWWLSTVGCFHFWKDLFLCKPGSPPKEDLPSSNSDDWAVRVFGPATFIICIQQWMAHRSNRFPVDNNKIFEKYN